MSRNKRSVTLNLCVPEGQALLRRLVEHVDVVVANARPTHSRPGDWTIRHCWVMTSSAWCRHATATGGTSRRRATPTAHPRTAGWRCRAAQRRLHCACSGQSAARISLKTPISRTRESGCGGHGKAALAAALVMMLITAIVLVAHGPQTVRRTAAVAYFANSNGLFPGDEVRVLGVPVGKIDTIEPQPQRVKVSFWFDSTVQVPADVKAVILSPSLVTWRAIALMPA